MTGRNAGSPSVPRGSMVSALRLRSRNRHRFGNDPPAWRDVYRIPSAVGNHRCSARLQRIVVTYWRDIAMRPSTPSVFWTVGSSNATLRPQRVDLPVQTEHDYACDHLEPEPPAREAGAGPGKLVGPDRVDRQDPCAFDAATSPTTYSRLPAASQSAGDVPSSPAVETISRCNPSGESLTCSEAARSPRRTRAAARSRCRTATPGKRTPCASVAEAQPASQRREGA